MSWGSWYAKNLHGRNLTDVLKCLVMGLLVFRGSRWHSNRSICKTICSWADLKGKNLKVNNCLISSNLWTNSSAVNQSQAVSYMAKPLSSLLRSILFPSRFQSDKYYLNSHEAVLWASRQLFIHGWMAMCMKKISLHPPFKLKWSHYSKVSNLWRTLASVRCNLMLIGN